MGNEKRYTLDKLYKDELVDPELLGIRSQLITLLQNALRRDSYVGLSTIAVIAEAIAVDARYTIWVEDHATDEQQLIEYLTPYEQQRELVLAATGKLREDRDNCHFQRVLQGVIVRLSETMKKGPAESNL
jgi:hypothetical protein